MREKGVVYSSAPPSVLMSIRSILITILTLWIPLTPLMWLLYRQLYSANGPAKKRSPSNQDVNFDDVEGVDSAKVELMEVCFFTIQHLISDRKIFRYIYDVEYCPSIPCQNLLSIGVFNFLIISFWRLWIRLITAMGFYEYQNYSVYEIWGLSFTRKFDCMR